MANKKIAYIGLLQIFGPIFVVLGHSLNGLDCNGAWYVFSKEWIYIFHMPLFFLVSGYLLAHKGYLREKSYGQFIFDKTKRLIFPWLFWNLLFFVPKLLFWKDENVSLYGFIAPRQNVWTHTWFLIALFILFLAAPLFKKILECPKLFVRVIAVIVCVGLYMFPIKILPFDTEILTVSDLHKDLLFFVIGCILGQVETEKFKASLKKYRIWLILGAIATSTVSLIWFEITKPMHFIPCAFVLGSFLSVFVSIEKIPVFVEKIASCSFGIYIMHWPVMIAVRTVFRQVLNANVPITASVMCVLGYLVPILVVIAIRALPFERIKKPLKYLLGV